ncbi:hypothetical protein ACRHQN_27590 [Burkholderia pseudomallei]|uniref:hypothetical protein n=1 Tax=Burkholderia pseudomallei TaxID=28450 RepID=UPI004062CC15
MQANVAKPDFLTFSELAARWDYSAEYVHDLIRTGKIVPAVALTDQERYVGGRFSGGYVVGDVDNAGHQSYAEYYVGTVPGDDDHYENRPQCGRVVFCHSPDDDPDGGYSFQFVSESAQPGQTAQWFYLDHAARISSVDGERRFRFVWSEIERFEMGDAAVSETEACGLPEQRVVQHKLKNRIRVLDAEIDEAKKSALQSDDVNSVWAELMKMAEAKIGCLLGVGDGEVKYEKGGEIECFTKKNLGDRMSRRAKTR